MLNSTYVCESAVKRWGFAVHFERVRFDRVFDISRPQPGPNWLNRMFSSESSTAFSFESRSRRVFGLCIQGTPPCLRDGGEYIVALREVGDWASAQALFDIEKQAYSGPHPAGAGIRAAGLTILYLLGMFNGSLVDSALWRIGVPVFVLYFCFLSLRFIRLKRRLLTLGIRSAWLT